MIDYSGGCVSRGMTEIENMAIVRRLFEFVQTRGETENFAQRWAEYSSMYDPNVVIHEAPSLPYGGDYDGPDAVARHALAFQAAWDGLQAGDARSMKPQLFAGGDQVIVLWRLQGRNSAGDTIDMPALSVYRLRNKRVMESRMFTFDSMAVRDFLLPPGNNRGV